VSSELNQLYHVTFLGNLDSIAQSGLQSGSGSTFGGGYEGHSQNRLFLTEPDGVSFWMGRYEELAEYHSEDAIEDGLIPVALEVWLSDEQIEQLKPDTAGTRDAYADAYYIEGGHVDWEDMSVWDGNGWVDLDDVDTDAMHQVVLDDSEVIEEDGAEWREAGDYLSSYFAPAFD